MSTWAQDMPDTITVASQTGARDDGAPTYGTQRTVSCMYVKAAKVVRNQDGEVADITSQIITHDEIKESDAIWVTGTDTSDEGESARPQSVAVYHDLDGSDELWEVTL